LFPHVCAPPGASRDATLTLSPGAFVESPGDYSFAVTATAVLDNPPFSATANGTLTVLGPGVYVTLQPTTGSTAPGAPYQVTVVNVGTASDTFNLSLAGPAAQVASLGASQTMTLAPGQPQVINITTSAADFADPGKPGPPARGPLSGPDSSVNGHHQPPGSADLQGSIEVTVAPSLTPGAAEFVIEKPAPRTRRELSPGN
jgi:hypothetical protein